ncbi:hypothetical protein [Aquipuribacter hungaricus]|uniref:Uncharacterized protein n=1 Tax=Aquipuribacter hungaricus TaxID=545624 RepID=A0ABV7WER4_9MICO
MDLDTSAVPEYAAPAASEVDAFYRTVLATLRPDATQVVADLLGRTGPLPPAAREAAFTLHRLNRPSLLTTVHRNPFQAVVVNDSDPTQWGLLLTIAPHASYLCLQGGGLFGELFTSAGTLSSVRAHLLPEQHQRVEAALAAVAAPALIPRRR